MINSRCASLRMLLLLVLVAFAHLCDAIVFLNSNWDLVPGEKFHLTWAEQVRLGTIQLFRMTSTAEALTYERLVISNTPDLQYDWLVPDDLPEGTYVLSISDVSTSQNYSPEFMLRASTKLTTSTTMASASTAPPSSTGTSGTSPPPPNSSPESDSGLTTGALAGIGISVAITAILIIGGVAFFFYKRGKAVGAKGAKISDDDWKNDAQYYKPETTREAKATSIYEMDASSAPMEMAVREQCTVEMPAPVQVLELESPRFGGMESPRFGVDTKSTVSRPSVESPRLTVDRSGFGKMDLEGQYKK